MDTHYFSFISTLVGVLAFTIFAFVLFMRDNRRKKNENRRRADRYRRRDEYLRRIDEMTVFLFPCGAKAIKLGAAEADKAITTNFEFKNNSIREGDVFLYGCDMCEKRGRCALYQCPFDPHGRRLLLEAVVKSRSESNAANGHKIAASVVDDDSRVPALSMVDVILKVKGLVFDDDSDIVVSLPPFADLVDRADDGDEEEDVPLKRSKKV